MFKKYWEEKTDAIAKFDMLKEENDNLMAEISEKDAKIKLYEEYMGHAQNKFHDSKMTQDKIADYTKRIALLDVNLIRLTRKYDAVCSEHSDVKTSLDSISTDFSEREQEYVDQINQLVEWQNAATKQVGVISLYLAKNVV